MNQNSGYSQTSLDEGRLVKFQFSDISRATLDAWHDDFCAIFEHTPPDGANFILLDFSAPDLSFTPYLRSKIQSALSYQHLGGAIVVIVPNSLYAQVVNMFMQLQRGKQFAFHATPNYEAGLAWLRDQSGNFVPQD